MSGTDPTPTTIARFNEAFDRHDVEAVTQLMTADVVFENTSGGRFEGHTAVRGVLTRAFALMARGSIETEGLFAAGGAHRAPHGPGPGDVRPRLARAGPGGDRPLPRPAPHRAAVRRRPVNVATLNAGSWRAPAMALVTRTGGRVGSAVTYNSAVQQPSPLYKRYRFPGERNSHAVWLCFRSRLRRVL